MVKTISFKTKRKAVAMIELIFAIVVMGFAMLAIPNITAQSAKSSQSAINQEAVSAVAAQMQNILSSHWDASDASVAIGVQPPILSLDGAAITDRVGIVDRSITDNNGNPLSATATTVVAIGTDDIGDYNGLKTPIEIIENSQDYSDKKLNMLSTVLYAKDDTGTYNFDPSNPAGGKTNIKQVSVTLTSAETSQENKNVTLHAFSCNIGTVEPKSKQYN